MVFALGGDIYAPEFASQKRLTSELLKYFLVSKKYVHSGLVIYGQDVKIVHQLKDFVSTKQLEESIAQAASPTKGLF